MIERIHLYTAPADKFYVNSFIIETPRRLIIVDTQFLLSTARDLAAHVAALGKPVEAIIISHPHPDHYNGLPVLLGAWPGTPVFATAATIAGIAATRAAKRQAWTPVYGADYPDADGDADQVVAAEATLHLAGVTLRMSSLGASECLEMTVIHLPEADALIASDLVYNRCHPWLAEHRTAAWLAQLNDMEQRFGDVTNLYPGHGPTGSAELLGEQQRYIDSFRTLVAAEAGDGGLTQAALARIDAQTRRGRERWPLDGLIQMNARAVAEELGFPVA